MPNKTRNDEIANIAVDQAISLLQAVVGSSEEIVVLTETRGDDCVIDLWLLHSPKNLGTPHYPYVVTNDAYGSSLRIRRFAFLTEAVDFYKDVRGAGSWSDYYADHPGEEKNDSPRK